MRRITTPLLFFFFLLSARSFSQSEAELQKALQLVNPESIKASMTFLADDLLRGRQPGTAGFELASKYVESEFVAAGLVPAGDNGNYRQRVPLQKGVVNGIESKFILGEGASREEWSYGQEFILAPYMFNAQSELSAPLVFSGFGVSAPELGYDDYKGVDVKGKIVVLLDQAPEKFGNNERAYFSSANIKYQEAVKRGAVGVIILGMSARASWEGTVRRSAQGGFKWLDKNDKASNAFEELKAIASVNPAHAEKLFKLSGKNLQKTYTTVKSGKPQSFPLKINAQIKVVTNSTQVESSNLIGLIPGSDPVLRTEHVVYVAHVDHFGVGNPVKGDSIYNGAHDNASGVAILLEIARTYRSLPTAPKRSVIIAVVTGEESGLLGSDYFATNPTVEGKLVANLALDMPFFFHPILDIVPYGVQHSSLSQHAETATKLLNLKISPDPFPEQVVFVRSDHFSFIKKGIPALFIKSGFMTSPTDSVDRSKSDVAWRSTTYHTPQDDMSQAFDFGGAATHVKVNFLIGLFTANADQAPTWNKGDFFGNRFGKN